MFFKNNPVLRVLLPFIVGICLQWYLPLSPVVWGIVFFLAIAGSVAGGWLKPFWRQQLRPVRGGILMLAAVAAGACLAYAQDVRNYTTWLGHQYQEGESLVATLSEMPGERAKSYKATAAINYLADSNKLRSATGQIIIYFKKDSISQALTVGDRIVFNRPPQPIKNRSNPGGFDFKRYCLLNGITHQVYLTPADYTKLPGNQLSWYQKLLYKSRNYVLEAIRNNIKGKKEQGLAEAMLIGYKEDLDKTLLQSYTNTGVVHVIAVSGMHLALLYWVIHLLLKPLLLRKPTRWMHPVLVLLLLWGFCFIAGGAASIARAAVMFTFITVGKQLRRQATIYNILAASAFSQLCYNPYWLWDVGFQLSYMAVLSIVVFYKPIYHLFFIKNKILDQVWQLASVSIAAQILTTPVAMYYFHQFPVYFLLNNMVVVPVSTVVLMGTLLLVMLAPVTVLAAAVGRVLEGTIWWLNSFIEGMESFPFALWTGIQINAFQTLLLLLMVAGTGSWLINRYQPGLWTTLVALLLFFAMRSYTFWEAAHQQKLIVCDTGPHTAIEFISGRNYKLVAHPSLLKDASLLSPMHTLFRVEQTRQLNGLYNKGNAFQFADKKIILISGRLQGPKDSIPLIDVAILWGNAPLYMRDISSVIRPRQVVVAGSVPGWRAAYLKQDFLAAGIPCHLVAEDGAFVMSLH